MLNQTENNFSSIFRGIGRTEEAQHADSILKAIEMKGELPYSEVVRLSQAHFPGARDFEDIIKTFTNANLIKVGPGLGNQTWVKWIGPPLESAA